MEKPNEISGRDDFGRTIARIAASQICFSAGFHSVRCSALDALADVAVRYVCDLGRAAHFYAGLSSRSDCNVFDIIQGLQDLGSLSTAVSPVGEFARFVSSGGEVPFARDDVLRFPIFTPVKATMSCAQIGEAPAGKHIPEWLPAFPELHTYVHTPVWNERAGDPRVDKIEHARQRRKAEWSLLSLQQRLVSNGMSGFFPATKGDAGKGNHSATKGRQVNCHDNPFLAQPLLYEEKGMPEIVIPGEDAVERRLPVLETFAPFIDAVMTSPSDPGTSARRVLPYRAKVHFRFGIDKTSVAVPLASIALGMKTDFLFLRDDEKDDKKRRAEMILRQAIENPEELTQLSATLQTGYRVVQSLL